jgi:hypothetical protein
MAVHFGEPRHQVLAFAVDRLGAGWHLDLRRGADFRNSPVAHKDSLILDAALAIHRYYGYADERDRRCRL